MTTVNNMQLYHLTLSGTTSVTQAIAGCFSGVQREQQIITANGSVLVLFRVDIRAARIVPILTHDTFSNVRQICPFRFAGTHKVVAREPGDEAKKPVVIEKAKTRYHPDTGLRLPDSQPPRSRDYIIITSDAGRIAIIEYNPEKNKFVQRSLETFGKSGVRRAIPSQYLAADNKGRACMIASVEKNKLVYILNRDTATGVLVSSPLEAHKPQTLVLALVALDTGYENPAFAALEIDYTDAATEGPVKELVYYELDLGLNHVIRKWHSPVQYSANLLLVVPGGEDGPSGVLVCGEDNITYRHNNQDAHRVAIPRRKAATEDPTRKRRIVSGIMHKMKGDFFFLVQTEDGDVFRVTMEMDGTDVSSIHIRYFETLPLATDFVILKSGFMYVASENGDQHFYKFDGLGDHEDEERYSSDQFPSDWTKELEEPVFFYPRELRSLTFLHVVPGLNPMTSSKILNLTNDDAPQIYSISGVGPRSTFRTLRHGLEAVELVDSQLPSVPVAVFTTKTEADSDFDAYIVLSFQDASLILSVGETVEEVSDSGLLTSCATLAVQLMDHNSLAQVHPRGLRLVKADGTTEDWPCPSGKNVVCAATNSQQICIALSSGELVYLESNDQGGLNQYNELHRVDEDNPSTNITALAIGAVPEGRLRSHHLAVGCDNNTVRVLYLSDNSDEMFRRISLQALTAMPSAMRIANMDDPTTGAQSQYLHIGLVSGVYLRTALDDLTGELSDARLRFLGPKAINLFEVTVDGKPAVLALASRPWLAYSEPQSKAFTLTPLDYANLQWAAPFTSHIHSEAIVGITGQELRILYLEDLRSTIRRQAISLTNTPRAFSKHPDKDVGLFYVVETDQHTMPAAVRQQLIKDSPEVNGAVAAANLDPVQFGYPKGHGYWTSNIEIVDPIIDNSVVYSLELDNNEAALCCTTLHFSGPSSGPFLIVGTTQDLSYRSKDYPQFTKSFIRVYRISPDGRKLEYIHKTAFDKRVTAMIHFRGRLLVAIGTEIRMYDLGIKQVLQKARGNVSDTQIMSLHTQGSRVIVTDQAEGLTYVVYKEETNQFIKFCDDTIKRWTTAATMVDYETVCGGDKWGNLWILRCPKQASKEADEEGSAQHLLNARSVLGGTANRAELLAHFYCQDIPTSIHKCSLLPGSPDIVVWGGLQGTIGCLIPFVAREDVEFFHKLELMMRKEDPPITGRDHLTFRSYYNPVKAVVDGDLCERFILLPYDAKLRIAAEFQGDKATPREIEKKIADMRARNAF